MSLTIQKVYFTVVDQPLPWVLKPNVENSISNDYSAILGTYFNV